MDTLNTSIGGHKDRIGNNVTVRKRHIKRDGKMTEEVVKKVEVEDSSRRMNSMLSRIRNAVN